ncbi:MAG: chorismate synthase [Bdellovibrionaceae bacterium]|nr:chorismate synthase [Pseudobdellovibrionaceae bacterium]
MSANSFGSRLVMHTFGESHGRAIGVLIDGVPAGLPIDFSALQKFLDRRKPGTSAWVSQRAEPDQLEIVSGIFEGKTLGTPICGFVYNQNARSGDYENIKNQPRHGHAEQAWKNKFGHIDHRGGGRSSGRETLSRVIAGAICEQALNKIAPQMQVVGWVSQIGEWPCDMDLARTSSRAEIDQFPARFPIQDSQFIAEKLQNAKTNGESYGGIAEIEIRSPLSSLGQPVFHKLKSDLATAAMSLGATLGVDFGEGIPSLCVAGTEFHATTKVTQYGGIQGGISTGDVIRFRVYFKPTSSILDVAKKGRHDPCIVPRAIPVLEAMASFVLMDHWLWSQTDKFRI